VKPPAGTNDKVVDSQIDMPETAAKRDGIQPVVHLSANGRLRADVVVGMPLTFTAVIEAPVDGDKVVAAEWDFEGRGDYPGLPRGKDVPVQTEGFKGPRAWVFRPCDRHYRTGMLYT